MNTVNAKVVAEHHDLEQTNNWLLDEEQSRPASYVAHLIYSVDQTSTFTQILNTSGQPFTLPVDQTLGELQPVIVASALRRTDKGQDDWPNRVEEMIVETADAGSETKTDRLRNLFL